MAAFVQLVIALQYIHERRILHRDLKSKNAFLTKSGVVKLGDFGICKVFDATDSCTETQIGTPYYLPPEMCTNQPYAYPADIWCLGIVFYELLALEVPFSAPSVPALAHKICTMEPPPVPGPYSSEAKALLARMLAKRPDERPTTREILQMPHVRRSAAALLAAASPAEPAVAPVAQRAVQAQCHRADGNAGAILASKAGRGSAADRRGLPGLADMDLDELLGDVEDGLPASLAVPVPEHPPDPPLSPTSGAEAAKFHSSLQQVLDSTTSCDQLLHELEQEFNFT